jgi:hypothetical protein
MHGVEDRLAGLRYFGPLALLYRLMCGNGTSVQYII